MGLEMGLPALLFPQGGGDVHTFYDQLMDKMERHIVDPQLRSAALDNNRHLRSLDADSVQAFIACEAVKVAGEIARLAMSSRTTQMFDHATRAADAHWQ